MALLTANWERLRACLQTEEDERWNIGRSFYNGFVVQPARGAAGSINLAAQRMQHRSGVEDVIASSQNARNLQAAEKDVIATINANRGGVTYDVDAEALLGYLQESSEPNDAASTLGVTMEEVEQAAERGDVIPVMAGEYIAMNTKDETFVQKMGDYTTFGQTDYSPANEQRQQKLRELYAQQAVEQANLEEAFQAQLEDVAIQAVNAGLSKGAANGFKRILEAVARTYSYYNPTDYLRKHPLRIVNGELVTSIGGVDYTVDRNTGNVKPVQGAANNAPAQSNIPNNAPDQGSYADYNDTEETHYNEAALADYNDTDYDEADYNDSSSGARYNQNVNAYSDPIAQAKLQKDIATWKQTVDDFTQGNLQNDIVPVLDTPAIFKFFGAKDIPVVIRKKTMRKILYGKHGQSMNADVLKNLPEDMTDPVAIFQSATVPGKKDLVVAVALKDDNNSPVVATFRLEEQIVDGKNQYVAHLMTSTYGKDKQVTNKDPKTGQDVIEIIPRPEWFKEQIESGRLKYINKKKLPNLIDSERLLAQTIEKIEELHPALIVKDENDFVNYKLANPGYYQEQLQQTAEEVTPGTVELNAVSAKDERSRKYLRQTLTGDKYGMTNDDVDGLFDVLDAIVERVENIAEEFPTMKAWQGRDINDPDLLYRIFKEEFKATFGATPTRSSFKKNGEYELNFDLGTLCTKRESMDLIIQILTDEGYLGNLGPTQMEALKSLLKDNGYSTACDICFVESKRVRALNDANKFTFEWKSVLLAAGINDDYEIGYNREFTPEQFNRLMELASADNKEAFDKYMPAERKRVKEKDTDLDTGITASKASRIAKLMLQDSALANNFRPEWLLTTRGTDWLERSFAHTNLGGMLASMYGAATAKPLEGFNIYDFLSWYKDFDSKNINKEHIFNIGGFRAQSFTDFNAILFLDYVQMFIDLQARGLPLHTYTKVPAFVELFGETGAMINMSLVPEIVQGATQENAGLKKDSSGKWVYAWASESFPVEKAMELRQRPEYGGRVGTIAVGASDMHIEMMLNDPNIDMIIPYHSSGMPASVKTKTGLVNAKDYQKEQTTKVGKEGNDTFSYNKTLRELGDPRKAAQAYLDYCKENGYTPKFPQFQKHKNYYKLLEDFRGYNGQGEPVLQQPVRMKLPGNWEYILRDALAARSEQDEKRATMKANKKLMDKARQIVTPQRLDGEIRQRFVQTLKSALGTKNVFIMNNADFLDQLQLEYKKTLGAEAAASKVAIYRKGDGIIHGFTKNGKVYLNENYFNANTPAHEFTHVWARVAQAKNPELWDKGKKLLQESEEWQEVLNDPLYADIIGDENAVASEVLARIVGKENEEYIRQLVDPTYKMAKNKALREKIMAWVQEMFKAIRSIFDNAEDLTYDEFIHMPLKTLWDTSEHAQFITGIKGTYRKNLKKITEIMAEREPPNNTESQQGNYNQDAKVTTKGFFNPEEGVIGLFKGADASTVIHEGGHFFVENLINDVLSGEATEQMNKDAEALMKYCGITLEQWKGMSVDERRQYHEKLAEAFESYIIQGRAPSKSLRSVFRRFSDWLTKVYKLAKGEYLNANRNPNAAELDPEVIAVFDHMLASQEEIAQAERLSGYMAAMPKVVKDNLSENALKMLDEAVRNAHDRAVEMMTKQAMSNFTAERKAKIADLREELLEPITNAVKQEPLYVASAALEENFAKSKWRAKTIVKRYQSTEAKKSLSPEGRDQFTAYKLSKVQYLNGNDLDMQLL